MWPVGTCPGEVGSSAQMTYADKRLEQCLEEDKQNQPWHDKNKPS